MRRITLDVKTGKVSAELAHNGVAEDAGVHLPIEVADTESDALPISVIARSVGAFEWLADEPNLYASGKLVLRSD